MLPCGPAHEKRYPYLDRDLLEFLFAVPREQLLRPGQRQPRSCAARLQGSSRGGLESTAEGIRSRAGRSLKSRNISTWLLPKLDTMITKRRSALSIAPPSAGSSRTPRVGLETLPVALWRTIGMEAWLRNLEARGLLKCEEISAQEPDIALNECFVRSEQQRSFRMKAESQPKEVILMKYEKPEVRLSVEAILTIETFTKGTGLADNIVGDMEFRSTPAYESDE